MIRDSNFPIIMRTDDTQNLPPPDAPRACVLPQEALDASARERETYARMSVSEFQTLVKRVQAERDDQKRRLSKDRVDEP